MRVSTLTPATIAQLDRLGAWRGPAGLASVAAPFDAMAVWDGAGTGAVHYTADDGRRGEEGRAAGGGLAGVARGLAVAAAAALGLPPPPAAAVGARPASSSPASGWLGAVAENEAVVAALVASLRASPAPPEEAWGCGGLAALALPPYARGPGAGASSPLASLTLAGGQGTPPRTLTARLVVGADGAGSAARAAAGLRVVEKKYRASAVVGTVAFAPGTPPAAARTAYQVFLPGGPLALLPLRDGHASVVWTLPHGEAAALVEKGRAVGGEGGHGPAAFAAAVDAALQRGDPSATGTWPGRAPAPPPPHVVPPAHPTPPASFPLRLRLAPAWVRPRFALLGDAAHAVHPLAGQGVNLGFADAACLSEALARAVAAGGDVGALAPTLASFYQRARRPATGAWVAALDGLATLFGEGKGSEIGLQAGVAAAVRGAGLRAVGAVGPARAAIVRFASGV